MTKQINRQNFLTTPFVAIKQWELDNVNNEDLILLEPSASGVPILDTSLALEYIDYNTVTPSLNRNCNISPEQQPYDLATYEQGISGSGLFNPNSETKNNTGTYKRLVYNQIGRSFYNNYKNPLQIMGMDNIDFPLSETNRNLTNQFLLFTIPQKIMGDGLVNGSIIMYDTEMDDNVNIYDDSNGNLIVGNNLFSKIQEVRPLGNIINVGTSSYSCPVYTP